MLSLDNNCLHTQVANFYKLVPRIQPSLLSSTNSNFGEYPQDFLCFFVTYYFGKIVIFSSEH